mmetsp:Transcript_51568/g.111984  ORF Transcript_51568/g.111984 Transcript_51568/m.111984 type:complete len:805 (-) Transcript_51568:57-2471(-)
MHFQEVLDGLLRGGDDLGAGVLLLSALEDEGAQQDVGEASDLSGLAGKGLVGFHDLLCATLATADLAGEGHGSRDAVVESSGHDLGRLAALDAVGGKREDESLGRGRLVTSGGLHVSGLHELVDDLRGELLGAEAKLSSAHARELLLDAGHDLLLQLGGTASVLPGAVGVPLDGGILVEAHDEDHQEDVLTNLLGGALVGGEEILAELLVLQNLVDQLAQQHGALITDDLESVPLLGGVGVEGGHVGGLEAGEKVVGAEVAESLDQRGGGLQACVLVLLLVAVDAVEHIREQALDVWDEVHLHGVRHGLHQLQETSPHGGLVVHGADLDLGEEVGLLGLVHLGQRQGGAQLLADLAGPELLEEPGQAVLLGVLGEHVLQDAEGLRRLAHHLGHGVGERGLEHGHHGLEEGLDAVHVLDQHGRGSEDLGGPLLAGGVALLEASDHHGHEQGEGGGVDEGQKGLVTHLGQHGLGVLLVGRLGEGRDQLLGKLLDLGTGDHGADLSEDGAGGISDLGSDLQRALGELGHDQGQDAAELNWGVLAHLLEAGREHFDAGGFGLPLLGLHAVQEGGDRDGGDAVTGGLGALDDLGGGLDRGAAELAVREEAHEEVKSGQNEGRACREAFEARDGGGLGGGGVLSTGRESIVDLSQDLGGGLLIDLHDNSLGRALLRLLLVGLRGECGTLGVLDLLRLHLLDVVLGGNVSGVRLQLLQGILQVLLLGLVLLSVDGLLGIIDLHFVAQDPSLLVLQSCQLGSGGCCSLRGRGSAGLGGGGNLGCSGGLWGGCRLRGCFLESGHGGKELENHQ